MTDDLSLAPITGVLHDRVATTLRAYREIDYECSTTCSSTGRVTILLPSFGRVDYTLHSRKNGRQRQRL